MKTIWAVSSLLQPSVVVGQALRMPPTLASYLSCIGAVFRILLTKCGMESLLFIAHLASSLLGWYLMKMSCSQLDRFGSLCACVCEEAVMD